MNKDIMEILRDTETGDPLQLIEMGEGMNSRFSSLINFNTGKNYKIIDGIPIFINDTSLMGLNRKYQKFYDRVAFIYDRLNRIYYFLRHGINYVSEEIHRKYILGDVEIKPGDKVLEIGVGPGSNLRFLPHSAEYYGVDISIGMLRSCRKNLIRWGLNAGLFQAMAEKLPFKDNVFDVVYHVGGFNYFSDRREALMEMIRVSKPGAKIVIIDETVKSEEAAYKKVPVINKIYSNKDSTFSSPVDLIPENMEEVNVKELYNGVLYSLSFKIPFDFK